MKMEMFQFMTLFLTMIGGFGFIYKEIRSEIKDIREEISNQSKRSDILFEQFQNSTAQQSKRSDEQSKRSDHLYEMFIELVRKKK
jgi:hypothetical protein